jgi:D-alanyl-D-alanine carboxypeptidase
MLHEGETIRPLMRLRSADTFDWILFERDGQRWWTQAEFFIRVGPVEVLPTSSLANYEIGLEPVDRDTALPPNYMPSDLVPVPQEFVLGFKTILLRREAANALVDMLQEARRHDLEIRVFSGFRDFATQKRLYLEAIAHDGPKQNGTAAPGYSEHQLGTTVDVSNRDPKMVLSSRFGETAEGQWLFQHAHEFGFIHSYTTENTEEVGYKPEPWHLRYVGQKQAQQILASRKELNGTAP